MTEHNQHDVVEVLRERLGVRYAGSMESGRGEILRLIGSELGVGRDEAEQILQQQIDAGRIRYVTRAEHDSDDNRVAPRDGRSDYESDHGDRSRDPLVNAIPGQGGIAAAASGLTGGAAAPGIVMGGTSNTPAVPLDPRLSIQEAADGVQGDYWEFLGDRTGVVPSSTRKGQVEPAGT